MKRLLIIAIASAFAGSVYAQSPMTASAAPATTQAPAAKMDKASMGVDKHIQSLHDRLKITAAEESQWSVVAQAMRDSAVELDTAMDKREAGAPKTAIDDLTAYGDIAQAHVDGVKKMLVAFTPLYNAMPDDQKKLADAVFNNRGHAKKKSATAEKQ